MFTQEKEVDVLEKMHQDLWLVEINQSRKAAHRELPEEKKRPFWEALELLATPSR